MKAVFGCPKAGVRKDTEGDIVVEHTYVSDKSRSKEQQVSDIKQDLSFFKTLAQSEKDLELKKATKQAIKSHQTILNDLQKGENSCCLPSYRW